MSKTDLDRWRHFLEDFGLTLTEDGNAYDRERTGYRGFALAGGSFDRNYADVTLWFDAAGTFRKLEASE